MNEINLIQILMQDMLGTYDNITYVLPFSARDAPNAEALQVRRHGVLNIAQVRSQAGIYIHWVQFYPL